MFGGEGRGAFNWLFLPRGVTNYLSRRITGMSDEPQSHAGSSSGVPAASGQDGRVSSRAVGGLVTAPTPTLCVFRCSTVKCGARASDISTDL